LLPRQFEFFVQLTVQPTRWPDVRLRAYLPPGPVRANVVLLHDLGADSLSLAAFATHWAEHGYRVLTPDLPGHGATAASLPRGCRDFSELVEALLAGSYRPSSANAMAPEEFAAEPGSIPQFVGGLGWGASAALNVAAGAGGAGLSGLLMIEPVLAEIPAMLRPTARAAVGHAQRLESAEAVLAAWRLDWLLGALPVNLPVVHSSSAHALAALPYRFYRPFSRGPNGLERTFWCECPVLAMLPLASACIDVERAATQLESFGTGFEVRRFESGETELAEFALSVAAWSDDILLNPVREAPQPIYPPGLPSHPSHRKPTWIG